MATTDDYLVKCPFYRIEKRVNNYYRISCEPPETAESLSLLFNKTNYRLWKNRYCRSMDGYKDCPIAGMYLEK